MLVVYRFSLYFGMGLLSLGVTVELTLSDELLSVSASVPSALVGPNSQFFQESSILCLFYFHLLCGFSISESPDAYGQPTESGWSPAGLYPYPEECPN